MTGADVVCELDEEEARMFRRLRLLTLACAAIAIALGVLLSGCGPSAVRVQAQAASAVAIAANGIEPALVQAYTREKQAAVDAAPDQPSALLAEAAVRAEWMPIVRAWTALQSAQDAWATALETESAGQPITAGTMLQIAGDVQRAYCALRAALDARAQLPDVPGVACTATAIADGGGQ